jgi:energy-coupling factor transporter ATP-binding protein EcfA2
MNQPQEISTQQSAKIIQNHSNPLSEPVPQYGREGQGVRPTIPNPQNLTVTSTPILSGEKSPPNEARSTPPLSSGEGSGVSSVSRYNLHQVLSYLEKTGKSFFGDHFKIYNEDQPVIEKLLVYFLADRTRAKELDINLKKGIMLTGPVGCGKTTLMTLMRLFLHPKDQHIMKPCRDITFEFIEEGFQIIHKYGKASFQTIEGEVHPKPYCFDDLGLESNPRHFGNECNIMAEILFSRYDLFISRGMQTHITTNLNSSEIEGIYNVRLRSRLREMMNLISFNKSSTDKRS